MTSTFQKGSPNNLIAITRWQSGAWYGKVFFPDGTTQWYKLFEGSQCKTNSRWAWRRAGQMIRTVQQYGILPPSKKADTNK